MGNTARKPANRFHFLGHSQLPLEYSFFSYVLGKYFKICRRSVSFTATAARATHSDRCAILALPLHFHVFEFFRTNELVDHALVLPGLPKNIIRQIAVKQFFFRFISEHCLKRRIDLQQTRSEEHTSELQSRGLISYA